MIYKRPVVGPALDGFIRPFTFLSWMLTFGGSTAICFALCILITLGKSFGESGEARETSVVRSRPDSERPVDQQRLSKKSVGGRLFLETLAELAGWCFGVLLTQSVAWNRREKIVWMLAGFWVTGTLIIATIYKSNLKAMLISPRVQIPFNNYEELVNKDELEWRVMANTAIHQFFVNVEPDSFPGRAWRKRGGVIYETDLDIVVDNMLKEHYVGMGTAVGVKSILQFYYLKVCFWHC
ncbi:uncharacterized protein LOC143027491 [Oratosquilla oratoria]|uniref:uncharacterized protein LOC143027491 n=1 Tax=Oratosquilla oratoria TaxID=337810 RepID=UPI003F768298